MRNIVIFLTALMLLWAPASAVEVSRSKVDHPALGTAGGAALHAAIEAIYTKLGDNANSRYQEYSAIADSTTVELDHNFGVAITELTTLIYTGSGSNLTRVQDPAGAGWTIAAKVGSEKLIIEITTPGSGGPHTFAAVVIHGSAVESIDDLDDVDISTTPPEEGQALVWDVGGSEFIPGASGDSSFKYQEVSGTDLTIKSGFIIMSDGRELRLASDLTYDLSGYTIDGDYYGYIDLNTLPAQTTVNGREVYEIASANIIHSTTTPDEQNLGRYLPLGALQRSGGTWQNQTTLAVRRHDLALGADSSLEFQRELAAVGNVGDASNIRAGHILDEPSFPSSLTTELSFYNLDDLNDDSTNGRNLTDTGSVPYTATGVTGAANTAASFNGTNQFLYSTDAHFNPGDNDFTCGAWVQRSDWSNVASRGVFGNWDTGDKTFRLSIAGGNFVFSGSTDLTSDLGVSSPHTSLSGWVNVVFKYQASSDTVFGYVNAQNIGSINLGAGMASAATSNFVLGREGDHVSRFWDGDIDEFYCINGDALSDEEIQKAYASKISHNRGLAAQDQKWSAWAKAGDITLPTPNYVVDLDLNDLYVDFSDQLSTTQVDLKLHNRGGVGLAKASKARTLSMTAAELDAILPYSHNLGVAPEISFKAWNGSAYEIQDHGSFFLPTTTQITLTGGTLASRLGGSTNVILNWTTGSIGQYVPTKLWNSYKQAGSAAVQAWDEVFADTTGGIMTLTLPSSPSIGDRVKVTDWAGTFDSFAVTIARNGNKIQGVAADLTMSTEGDSVVLVFNGTDDWRFE